MNDRELLEMAAKAARFGPLRWQAGQTGDGGCGLLPHNAHGAHWNPLTSDGDALRLAVKVLNWPLGGRSFENAVTAMYAVGKLPKDPYEATRRAIVRAAAEIGAGLRPFPTVEEIHQMAGTEDQP